MSTANWLGRYFFVASPSKLWHALFMHETLIDKLGGYKWLATQLNLKPNRVRMWRVRGVAQHYRPTIARMATERQINLPKGFLEPRAA